MYFEIKIDIKLKLPIFSAEFIYVFDVIPRLNCFPQHHNDISLCNISGVFCVKKELRSKILFIQTAGYKGLTALLAQSSVFEKQLSLY